MSLREGSPTAAGLKRIAGAGRPRAFLDHGRAFLDIGEDGRAGRGIRRRHLGGGENMCEMKFATTGDPTAFLQQWEAYARRDNYLRKQAFFADGVLLERGQHAWDDIVLPPTTQRTVQLHVEQFLKYRKVLRRQGVKPRRGLMLAGPPGTGKSLLCRILADQLDATFIWVMPRHLRSPSSV